MDELKEIEELTAATDHLVTLLQSFFNRLQVDHPRFDVYLSMALGDTTLRYDIPQIKAAIRRRAEAQQAVATAAQSFRERIGA